MTNHNLHTQVPVGVRDILPEEAGRKRKLEEKVCRVFQQWAYQEVLTPTFEFYQAMMTGSSSHQEDTLYKFLDRQGHILSLRPDMTTPIARLVATRLKETAFPLRLFYMANVFNYADPQVGRQREFYQAGVELLGSTKADADGEVIALAVESLKAAGLSKFQINMGQMEIFNGLMEELGMDEPSRDGIKKTISNKNFVGLEEQLGALGLTKDEKDRVVRLLTLHGGREVIDQGHGLTGNERALKALDNLTEVYQVLESYGVSDYVSVDLGVLRGFDYYTGLVFEGYSPALGFPICGGGRYDGLVSQFGYDCPATGFAIGVDRVLLALNKQDEDNHGLIDYLIMYSAQAKGAALAKAMELRSQGYIVETEINGRSQQQAILYAQQNGIQEVLYLE